MCTNSKSNLSCAMQINPMTLPSLRSCKGKADVANITHLHYQASPGVESKLPSLFNLFYLILTPQ